MNELQLYQSRLKTARIAGFFYAVLAMAMFPYMVRNNLIVDGDANATAQNILANAQLYRMIIFGDLVCYVAFLFLAIYLYSLLQDVERQSARLMVALVLVAVPMAMLSASNEFAALALFQSNDPARAMMSLNLYKQGIVITEIFMGLWLFPLGWLFFKSDFMPKTLGILLMAGCFAYLANSFAGLLMPEWRALTQKGVMLPAVAEFATVFWLLVFGVKRPVQQTQRRVTA